jgi:demethylmenaquinone methyltransferase / 2-methoxy-6-polyprenyl-1,4-benzoquinol methylase
MDHDSVTPYRSDDEKRRQVERMFDNIAGRYDFLNSLLSFRIHRQWRNKCVKMLATRAPQRILDVATGTADFAVACSRLNPQHITGIDISEGMLRVGREKISKKGLTDLITLEKGDAETVEFATDSFDAIVVGFGVRNFQNLRKGLENLRRMLRPGGVLVVLEFSYPTNPVVKALYHFYFSFITPAVGRIFSRDRRAYAYLTESVQAFPHNEAFLEELRQCGFVKTSMRPLSFGIAAIYSAEK